MNIWEASEYFSDFVHEFVRFCQIYMLDFFTPSQDRGLLAYWPFLVMTMGFLTFFTIKRIISIFNGL